MTATDSELLNQFTGEHSEDAFATLVQRHLDLVYSAALRQVRSPELAQEVAQSVFTDLARSASTLKSATILTAWLYQVTRRTAVDVIRRESRRQARERLAVEMATMNASPDWTRMEPLLEEAMERLEEADRAAVLLRYFENKSLREVGQALGITDDAAQKRVSRAVDRLRECFGRKGVAIGAGSIALAVSANAVQAAPLGLASTISATAVLATAAHAPATIIAAKAFAMTSIQKIGVSAALAAIVGTGIYHVHQASALRGQLQALQQKQAPLEERVRQLEGERDEATNNLAAAREEIDRLQLEVADVPKLRGELTRLRSLNAGDAGEATKTALVSWEARVNQLKQKLEQTPASQIPELQFLTEEDWLNAAKGDLKTDTDFRRALSALRGAGESKFASMLQPALKAYLQANNGQFPTDLAQLQPYFKSPVDPAVFQRWEIMPSKQIQSLGLGGGFVISQKAPVDDVFDLCYGVGPNGWGSTDFLSKETRSIVEPVIRAFSQAHNGELPDDSSALLAYATTPAQEAAIQKMILRNSVTTK